MMRALMTVIALLGVTISPATACNRDLFSVLDWRVEAAADGEYVRTKAYADIEYRGSAGYRMIQAAVMFSDVLGNALLSINVDRDRHATVGESLTVSEAFVGRDSRISTINRDDVVSRVCVWSIVYDDGTVEKFE
jgi:predicted N-acyltransferase